MPVKSIRPKGWRHPDDMSMVHEAIRQGVAEAIARRGVLRVQPLARQISNACPGCNMTYEAIAEEIAKACVSAQVPLQMDDHARAGRRSPRHDRSAVSAAQLAMKGGAA
jgi:hypothetical protein